MDERRSRPTCWSHINQAGNDGEAVTAAAAEAEAAVADVPAVTNIEDREEDDELGDDACRCGLATYSRRACLGASGPYSCRE
jgi:hypothetical protein